MMMASYAFSVGLESHQDLAANLSHALDSSFGQNVQIGKPVAKSELVFKSDHLLQAPWPQAALHASRQANQKL
jgi:hypothetical protein